MKRPPQGVELKAFRRELGYTQARFARVLRVKVDTLIAWELGRQEPSGAYYSLLQLVAEEPKLMLGILLKGRPYLRPPGYIQPLKRTA